MAALFVVTVFAPPVTMTAALLLWLWRLLRKKPVGVAPYIFGILLLGHAGGFLRIHSDPYFYIGDHIRDYIPLSGQIIMSGQAALPVTLPLVLGIALYGLYKKEKEPPVPKDSGGA